MKGIFRKWKLNLFEFFLLFLFAFFFPLLLLFLILMNFIDYTLLKNYFLKRKKWDLNICCGGTDGGGINADIVKRKVPNFILLKDVYQLPFKDKQFKNVISSHTIEHLENPDLFYKELKRVSENITFLIPPLWDLFALFDFSEHKWQFLTLKTKYVNSLPRRVKLPYWWYQKKFGQSVRR